MHQCTLIDLEQRKGKGKGSYYTVAKHVFVAEAAYYYVLWASVLLLASWNEQALSFFFGSLQSMRKTYTCYNYSNHELKPAAKRSCPSQPEPVQYSDYEKKKSSSDLMVTLAECQQRSPFMYPTSFNRSKIMCVVVFTAKSNSSWMKTVEWS